MVIIGALFGLLATPYMTVYPLRRLRKRLKQMPALDLLAATIGLLVGLLLGALFTWPLSNLPDWMGRVGPTVATLGLAWLGVYIAVLRRRDLVDALRVERAQDGDSSARGSSRSYRTDNPFGTGAIRPYPETTASGDKVQYDKYVLV